MATDKEKIENLIIKSSPFSDAHGMTTNIVDFQKNDEGLFVLDNGKTGKYSITYNDNEQILIFDFDGKSYEYKYTTPYFLHDVTSDYKADYPELESAILRLRLSRVM